jgi:hypothetical protein
MEVGAVPLDVLEYDLGNPNEVDANGVDESLNYDKGSPLFCQIAIRKILLNDDGLKRSILVCHTLLFIINGSLIQND